MEMAIVTDQEKEIKDVPKERNHRKKKNNGSKQLLSLKKTNINVQDDVTVSSIKTKIDENIQVKYKTVSKSSFLCEQLDDSKLNKFIVLIGGIEVPQEKLALRSRKASLTKFVKNVMLLIFTEQEMANSSLTGTTPNLHANHKDDVLQKQKLDPI